MFTGIIESIGEIVSIKSFENLSTFQIKSNLSIKDSKIGDSFSINGTCLTVTEIEKGLFSFDVVMESLKKTNFSLLSEGHFVNIEQAVKLNGRLNGHLVQGHVESMAKILKIENNDNEVRFKISLDANLLKYCIYKGSICVDGISLTIAEISDTDIELAIIPHTFNNTNLKYKKIDNMVNIETDMISKYVHRFIKEMDIK
tara:strand:- start:227 stop:826 length:600 start_codon:yes stop_codon:yes gene_type:complete